MPHDQHNAPMPDLRIVPTESLCPHEDHDSQRSEPLIERLRHETVMINPPLVAPMDDDHFVILDGANRCHSFAMLGYPHMLVQVAPYGSGVVDLRVWRHIVSNWDADALLSALRTLPGLSIQEDAAEDALVHLDLRDGRQFDVVTSARTAAERNAALRRLVQTYQQNGTLERTALEECSDIWTYYPHADAVVTFPEYSPEDIIIAAKDHAFLPPGVSRHIVQGRAIRINYPLAILRDPHKTLQEKNLALQNWLQEKLEKRHVRYYAEATYQFDE